MRDWPQSERPRERMVFQGEKALTDAELVALLLGSGHKSTSKSALDLSRDLLEKYESFKELACVPLSDIMQAKGIGQAKATRIKACFEISRRIGKQQVLLKKKVFCAKDVFDYFSGELSEAKEESTAMLFIGRKNEILSSQVTRCMFNSATVNPRQVVQEALEKKAMAVILCHNHPSENTIPTEEDKKTTLELKSILEKLEIILLDHVIISKNKHYSFAEEGSI